MVIATTLKFEKGTFRKTAVKEVEEMEKDKIELNYAPPLLYL